MLEVGQGRKAAAAPLGMSWMSAAPRSSAQQVEGQTVVRELGPHPPPPPCGHTCTAEPASLKWVVRVCPPTALEFLEPRDCVIDVYVPRARRMASSVAALD